MTDADGVYDLKKTSVSRNVLFSFLGWVLPLCFTFVLTPFIIRGLGSESFGLYLLIMGVVGYLASLNFNVGRAITKYVSAFQVNRQTEQISEVLSTTLGLYLLIGIVTAGGMLLLSNWLVVDALKIAPALQPVAELSLTWAAAGLLFTLLSQVFGAIPQALQRFDLYGIITIISGIASVAGSALIVWLGLDVAALTAWVALVSFFTSVAFIVVTHRLLPGVRLTGRVQKPLLVGLLKFSGAVTAYQIFGNLLVLFERGWLTRSLGAAAVTYYVVPMTIAIYIHSFITSLTLVIFPMVSEAGAHRDTFRLRKIYTRAYKYVSVLAVFPVITLVVNGHQFLSNWMGEDFASKAVGVLEVQAIAFGLLALLIVAWQVADGLGFPSRNAILSLIWLAIVVPVGIWLTPRLNILGLAWARLLAMGSVPVYIIYIERRVFGHWLASFWARTGVSLLFGGGLAAIVQVFLLNQMQVGWLWLSAEIGFSGVVYLSTLWAIGYLDEDERKRIRESVVRAAVSVISIMRRSFEPGHSGK